MSLGEGERKSLWPLVVRLEMRASSESFAGLVCKMESRAGSYVKSIRCLTSIDAPASQCVWIFSKTQGQAQAQNRWRVQCVGSVRCEAQHRDQRAHEHGATESPRFMDQRDLAPIAAWPRERASPNQTASSRQTSVLGPHTWSASKGPRLPFGEPWKNWVSCLFVG